MKDSHKQLLINSIKNKSSKILSNSNKEAYHLFLSTIFLCAENEINILVSNFISIDKLFDNNDFILINDFIKTKKLNLLYFKNFDNSNFIKNVDITSKNIKIKQLLSPIFDNEQLIQEFITWDNHGYRFSPNAKKLIGIISANDEDFTSLCNKIIFSKLS